MMHSLDCQQEECGARRCSRAGIKQGGGGGDIASAIANCICVIHKSFNCTNNNVQLCILAVNIFKLQFGSYKR